MNKLSIFALCMATTSCGWPIRSAVLAETYTELEPLPDFEEVRAVDGYPDAAFQSSFDEAIAKFAMSPVPVDGRRDFDMLVLSSGGVNGAFSAGIITAWTTRGDRPDFWTVTGVSVGALMAPFVFAGPEFDDRLEDLFRHLEPDTMHHEKGIISSVLWDESLMDNSPLRESIRKGVDERLLDAVATRHEEGRRLYVGSTNLDVGNFIVWDLGAIATRRTPEALDLFRQVLTASAAIPVVYPPVTFSHGSNDELHVDGAVVRPLFMPQNIFDGYQSAKRAGISWDDVDTTMYVIHNGSLRSYPAAVQRDTLTTAMRTVTMMTYTMVSEHVLHLYLLSRAWDAQFRFLTVPDGLELSVADFSSEDTDRLFLLGKGYIERDKAWDTSPPGYVLREDLNRVAPGHAEPATSVTNQDIEARLQRIENALETLLEAVQNR